MTEITDPETGETLTLATGDIGVSPIEHARLRKERDDLREALIESGRTCDFFRSVIMSGEPWSEATRASYDETKKLRDRALANLNKTDGE